MLNCTQRSRPVSTSQRVNAHAQFDDGDRYPGTVGVKLRRRVCPIDKLAYVGCSSHQQSVLQSLFTIMLPSIHSEFPGISSKGWESFAPTLSNECRVDGLLPVLRQDFLLREIEERFLILAYLMEIDVGETGIDVFLDLGVMLRRIRTACHRFGD